MNFYRGYAFTCACGLHVKGRYPITDDPRDDQFDATLDRDKAVCRMTKGAPSFPSSSVNTAKAIGLHEVGCGRTLAEVDAARLEASA